MGTTRLWVYEGQRPHHPCRWACWSALAAVCMGLLLLPMRPDDRFWHSLRDMPVETENGTLRRIALRQPFVVIGARDPSWVSRLMAVCGGVTPSTPLLMSPPTLQVLLQLNATLHPWAKRLLELAIAGSIDEHIARLHAPMTLRDAVSATQGSSQGIGASWLIGLVGALVPTPFARLIQALGPVVFSAPYIANAAPFCDLLAQQPPDKWIQEAEAAIASQCCAASPGCRAAVTSVNEGPAHPRFFWGGKGSLAYPVHVDGVDGDTVLSVIQGCKDVVVLDDLVPPDEIEARAIGQETGAYAIDVFNHAPIPRVEGYRHRLVAGEALFLPGELRHQVRNACDDTVGLLWRPWRRTAANQCFAPGYAPGEYDQCASAPDGRWQARASICGDVQSKL